jgi:hypothetical protein
MQVDIIGIDNVAEFIKNTGLSKFSIDRPGSSRGTLPVFELLTNNSNDKAIEEFKKWAKVVNGNNEYKLTLFDKLDIVTDETGEEKAVKSKSKSNKAEIYFKLSDDHKNNNLSGNNLDIENIRLQALNEFRTEQKIKDLEEKIKRLEEEEEEEEESGEELAGLGGLNIHNIVSALNALNMIKNNGTTQTNQTPTINGLNDDKIVNINKAIKILAKHDPDIDTDLLKLADMAENNAGTFQMLLKTLRSM